MAFNVTNLSTYVANTQGYVTKKIAEATTIKALLDSGNFITEVKGTSKVKKVEFNSVIALNDGCTRTGASSQTLKDVDMSVANLKFENDLCTSSLRNTYFTEALKTSSNPEEFEGDFMDIMQDGIIKAAAFEIEKLIWSGATTASTYNQLNGILRQSSVSATTVTPTGTTIAKLQAIYNASNAVERNKEDYRIFIPYTTWNSYVQEMAGLNLYNPTTVDTLFGTTAKLIPTFALSGRAWAGRLGNLMFGTDGTGDMDKIEWFYDASTRNTQADVLATVGISVVYPELTVVATV